MSKEADSPVPDRQKIYDTEGIAAGFYDEPTFPQDTSEVSKASTVFADDGTLSRI